MRFNVTFYETISGDKPVVGFLHDIRRTHPVLHDQVARAIKRFEQSEVHGPPLTLLVDPVSGIYELRVGRADIARVFFFFRPGQEIVVTNGYVKKRQRLDPSELERARRMKSDWEARFP